MYKFPVPRLTEHFVHIRTPLQQIDEDAASTDLAQHNTMDQPKMADQKTEDCGDEGDEDIEEEMAMIVGRVRK